MWFPLNGMSSKFYFDDVQLMALSELEMNMAAIDRQQL